MIALHNYSASTKQEAKIKMLNCKWLGIDLRSPLVLASLTMLSKQDIKKHIEYYEKAAYYGVGAIVLPTIHPSRTNESIDNPQIRITAVPSGLEKNEYMGFAVLGRTENILPMDYGVTLIREAVRIGIPIIASIANVGTIDDFLGAIQQVRNIVGLSGIELNFSCPSVIDGLPINGELLREIRALCKILPITIKLAPYVDYAPLLENKCCFEGITYSNAQRALLPPNMSIAEPTPFDNLELWRPTGIYGPQEKLSTFYNIWKFKTNNLTTGIHLSSVGGFVSPQDVIQAIMLGSDTVQLSSAILWKGLKTIEECNKLLYSFLEKNNLSLVELNGISIKHIVSTEKEIQDQFPVRYMSADKCNNCEYCSCIERGCYAFQKARDIPAEIDRTLCSGCGWCMIMCKYGIISEVLPKNEA